MMPPFVAALIASIDSLCWSAPDFQEVRDLIRTMWQANPTWGAPRIVGELGKLGIDMAESTVEKY